MKKLVIIVFIFFYGQSNACVCAKTESVKKSFDKYPLIVHGRVINISTVLYSTSLREEQLEIIRSKLKNDHKRLASLESKVKKVTFQIIEIIKGDSISKTVTIFTSINTSCDINFKKNKKYLVYGTRKGFNDNLYMHYTYSDNDFTIDNHYWTDYCTRTKPYNEEEKRELNRYKIAN